MPVDGRVADGWDQVRAVFTENLVDHGETGAGVAVYHRGRCVVDLTGGWFDKAREVPYDDRTLQLVFSTTKGVAAIALAMLVDRGLLDYAAPVARYWPEFASRGKGDATVAQLISHQCGLHTVDAPVSLQDALDWGTMVRLLADTEPAWPIGSGHGYHALTYGWLAGELVRRIDGRSVGRFVREEIAGPLGAEMYIGLPTEHAPRVSPLTAVAESPKSPEDRAAAEAMAEMMAQVMGPETRGGRALSLNGAFGEGAFNLAEVHAAEIPAANGISTAASLARIYAATTGEVDGVRLLSERVRDVARATVTPVGEADLCLIVPTTFGMGFMTSGMFSPYAGPGSYGHPGAGGSVAFAHPERELSFAYVMNAMAANLAGDTRAQRLIDAAVRCADAA